MIRVQREGRVAIVEISDCRLLSAHDGPEARELTNVLRDLAYDETSGAIVLSAAGNDFCPELAQPQGMQADASSMPWYRDYATSSGLYQTLCYYPKVVVAAVQGVCTGAGSALLLCTDLAVISDDAQISPPFATIPEASFTLAALSMRLNCAKAWAITEDALDAATAADVGLVNRAVPRAKLLSEACGMAAAAARMPADGMAMSKLMRETYLDSQSVGREFDQARFYAAGIRAAAASGKGSAA